MNFCNIAEGFCVWAPIHFAVTYRQLDMVHHLLNSGAEVNQQDPKGLTPLHRAAYLAHLDGYLELYEYLLSQGADPSICSLDSDPYLDPGCKLPTQLAATESTRAALIELERKYSGTAKMNPPPPVSFPPCAACSTFALILNLATGDVE
eukprot:gene5516-4147_t